VFFAQSAKCPKNLVPKSSRMADTNVPSSTMSLMDDDKFATAMVKAVKAGDAQLLYLPI